MFLSTFLDKSDIWLACSEESESGVMFENWLGLIFFMISSGMVASWSGEMLLIKSG